MGGKSSVAEQFEGLWNPSIGPTIGEEEDEYCELVLEQYRIYLETAEHTSNRRLQTNAFFITLNTAILAGASFVFSEAHSLAARLFAVVAILAGIFLSVIWYRLIGSYRAINTSKFEVVGELEQRLPSSPVWNEEWARLREPRKGLPEYIPLTALESRIPIIMMCVYAMVFFIGIFSITNPSMLISPPDQLQLLPVSVTVSGEASAGDSDQPGNTSVGTPDATAVNFEPKALREAIDEDPDGTQIISPFP